MQYIYYFALMKSVDTLRQLLISFSCSEDQMFPCNSCWAWYRKITVQNYKRHTHFDAKRKLQLIFVLTKIGRSKVALYCHFHFYFLVRIVSYELKIVSHKSIYILLLTTDLQNLQSYIER